MKEKAQPPRLALWVSPHDWKDYSHADNSCVYTVSILRVEPKDDKPRNCSRTNSYEWPQLAMLDDLRIACYVSWYDDNFSAGSCWQPRYQGYMILDAVEEAKTLYDGLKRCDKIRSAFPVQPTSFGQYACLLAAGLGAREYCTETSRTGSGFYTDSQWAYGPINRAAELIDAEIAKIKARVLPEPVQEIA